MAHTADFIPVLKESLQWLGAHPNPSCHDVPEQLAIYWLTDSGSDGAGFCAFIAGHFRTIASLVEPIPQYLWKGRIPELSYTSDEVYRNYNTWRIRLAISILQRHSGIRASPKLLFRFTDEPESFFDWDVLNRRLPKGPPA